ncbi:FAD-dependent oxidoreductase [Notoacmeibacter sp. MSK16QG-6]|uniref:FAD-dependent oxidoreductase n=1 Tax=Notoacmeibacter sp. MSK16QG-6 TaxID=2957982 RepID=UPI00209C7ACE|nr:FAD-dependent oxidoreductase [Notoacmeibacter sp. MSK16QG-6]MCP1198337.1 FAD-dependent oxidoreductase [Notoacmeibacter sp. MSK16QG-6]
MDHSLQQDIACDVAVVGSGAGGMSTAIVAAKNGLDVVIVEKASVFGGTTAFSGGVLWIPGNPDDPEDDIDRAREYLAYETGNFFDADAVEAYLETGPQMLRFLEEETAVSFVPTLYPDYHPDAPGGAETGRSVLAKPFDASQLGDNLKRLRPPLSTITFMGMMFNSSNADIKHFFNVTKSARSLAYVTKRLLAHGAEYLRHGRGTQITSGNALAARLAKTCFDLGIPIYTDTAAKALLAKDGRISGLEVEAGGKNKTVTARRGVVLAAGGFAHDYDRIGKAYEHLRRGGEHFSPVPLENTGDGIRLAERAGVPFETRYPNTSAWMPVSKVPDGKGGYTAFPHLLDRYKPGIFAVLKNGRRFTNESNSYHDFGEALLAACEGQAETVCWLIADHRTVRKYGLGHAKPAPMPLSPWLRNGYLVRGKTLAELARKAGIDPAGLEQTAARYNDDAARGEDRQFGRGSTAFNRYLADPDHRPNPCVAPIRKGPFYALRIIMGDLGTFDGLQTTVKGQVIGSDGAPIEGLFAVGNDRASIMGGAYPGAGITLGPALTFGYITGRFLAEQE